MSTSTVLRIAIALAILVGAGRGILSALVRKTALYWFERWSLAFLLGTGALSIAWFALSPLYGMVRPLWLLSAVALALAVPAARGAKSVTQAPLAPGGIELVLCVLLALELGAIVIAGLHLPLGWDGLFNFEMKARLAFENLPQGRLPIEYFSDASRGWSHPRYPLMVPFAEYWFYAWLGRVDQTAIKMLFVLFYASLLALVCGAATRLTNLRVALITALAMGLLPPLTVQLGATSGYADVPLAAAVVGAACFAAVALNDATDELLVLAAALSALAVWTKAEGLLLALSIGVSAMLVARRQRGFPLRRATLLLWLPLAVAVPWWIVQRRYGMPEADFLSVTPRIMAGNVGRIPAIVGFMLREFVRPGHWGAIWPVAVAAFGLMIVAGQGQAGDRLLAGAVLMPLTLYALVFMFSAWPDLGEHMASSLPRLLVPLAPLAMIFTTRRLSAELGVNGPQWR